MAFVEYPGKGASVMRSFRDAWAVLALALSSVAFVPTAGAAAFDVRSCAASSTKNSNAWVFSVAANEQVGVADWCTSPVIDSDSDTRVDFTRSLHIAQTRPAHPPLGVLTPGRIAGLSLSAPPGGRLLSISYHRRLQVLDDVSWQMHLMADGVPIDSCILRPDETQCRDDTLNGVFTKALAPDTQKLDLAAWCTEVGCSYGDGPLNNFAIALYSSVVKVEELVAPSAGTPVVEGLTADGWAGPSSTIRFAGSDPLGLRKLELYSNGRSVAVKNGVCVDWSVRPCAEGPGGSVGLSETRTVASLGLDQGNASMAVVPTDAAGNAWSGGIAKAKIDTMGPEPRDLYGSGVSSEALRWISWNVPFGGSALASGTVKLCRVRDGHCETFSVSPAGPFGFSIPAWGDVMATVSLKDAAGNAATAAPIRLTYEAPTAASPTPAPAPTPTPTPAPTPTPTAGILDAKRLVLKATFPKKLGRRSVLVTGATSAGSTTAVTLRLSGKRTNGKTFRVYKTVKPEPSGSWQARARLPRDIRRRSGVKASVTASPRPGWITPSVARQLLR